MSDTQATLERPVITPVAGRVYTAKEAAEYMRVSTRTVARMIGEGSLIACKPVSSRRRAVRIPGESLIAWRNITSETVAQLSGPSNITRAKQSLTRLKAL